MLALRAWRRLLSCRKGSSFIEFGFTAPAVILMVTGIIDVMMVIFVSSLLEGALQSASRLGRTGAETPGITREEAIVQKIADATIGLVDMGEVQITTKSYGSFQDIGQPEEFTDVNGNGVWDSDLGGGVPEPLEDTNGNGVWDPDQGTDGAGGAGDVVLYEVRYDWPLFTPLVGEFFGHDGKFPLAASIAIRNEPWDTPSPPLGG